MTQKRARFGTKTHKRKKNETGNMFLIEKKKSQEISASYDNF